VDVLDVEVPLEEPVKIHHLQILEVSSGEVVTVLELLSPANNLHRQGRRKYEKKRARIIRSETNLVEVDLLRAGRPMPVGMERAYQGDYRLLVSPSAPRPRTHLRIFSVR
jgi:hypothetical protein